LGGVLAPPALAGSGDRLLDALAGAHAGLLVAAVVLHISGQACRGLAWHGVLSSTFPGVTRRRACAWHVCGAGLSGVLSVRGGDAVRMALAKREVAGATWPALAGTIVAEGSLETVFTLVLALAALRLGLGTVDATPLALIAAVAVAVALLAVIGARSARMRRIGRELRRGLAILGHPRSWSVRVVPWQLGARLLKLAAIACFLRAFGLPTAPAVVLAAAAAQGSGVALPLPGAGPAAVAAALLAAVPLAAGHPVDGAAVAALAIVQPAALTAAGVALSLVLLAALSGARSPRAVVRAAWALRARPAPAPAAP
jgi:Lysylphosphatidylglycerol synthase TM region